VHFVEGLAGVVVDDDSRAIVGLGVLIGVLRGAAKIRIVARVEGVECCLAPISRADVFLELNVLGVF